MGKVTLYDNEKLQEFQNLFIKLLSLALSSLSSIYIFLSSLYLSIFYFISLFSFLSLFPLFLLFHFYLSCLLSLHFLSSLSICCTFIFKFFLFHSFLNLSVLLFVTLWHFSLALTICVLYCSSVFPSFSLYLYFITSQMLKFRLDPKLVWEWCLSKKWPLIFKEKKF